MSLILFGFKGCGKTCLGKYLSARLDLPFLDTDELILEKSAIYPSIRSLYQKIGADRFRQLEAETIQSLHPAPSIIAVGGGSMLDPRTVSHLQTLGQLIYLKTSFETLFGRIMKGGLPPFADPKDPEGSLRKIYLERISVYEAIPALTLLEGWLYGQ